MKNITLPKGDKTLNQIWKDAKWDVSGLFTLDDNIIATVDRTKDRWDAQLPIESVHGCPLYVHWNGGRVISIKNVIRWNPENIRSTYLKYNERNIAVYNTFSNHLLKNEHLSNKDGNEMLEILSENNTNGIIVSSDLLAKYVRTNYPDLKQKSSIIKASVQWPHKRTVDNYKELLDEFDCVVLHPDDNFKHEILEGLSEFSDRIEILINEPCVVNCKIRKAHYHSVALDTLSFQENKPPGEHEWNFFNSTEAMDCGLDIANKKSIINRSCQVSDRELKEMYDMGYRHFKLQGRDTYWYKLRYDICYYMYEHEKIFPLEVKL